MIKLAVVCLLLAVILALTLYASYKLYSQQKKEIKRLEQELTMQKENSAILARHVKKLIAIHNSEEKYSHLIKEAKTDEELISIVNSIVSGNNSRVSK